ncbi:MAG: DUF262 domain-containing protein [Candidatus Omnitrophota bacterium]
MKAFEQNLNRFLSLNGTQFVIPVYQRNYDWKIPECKQLLDDIINAGKDTTINFHFIGSIVFIQDENFTSSEVRELTIIDGQQRITTITLIYIAIFHFAKRIKDLKLGNRIEETYLINKFFEKEKLKLRPTDNNDKDLKSLIYKDEDVKIEGISRVIQNYNYLAGEINQETIDQVIKGLDKLMFVEISLDRDKDNPQRIFESLNSTGLDLSQADLIRNYILMGLKKQEQTIIYEKFWFPIEAACSEDGINPNKVNLSEFFKHILTIETGVIPIKDKVYEAFKKKYPNPNTDEFEKILLKIKNYSVFYNKLTNPQKESDKELSQQIAYINNLKITVSYPFLLEVYRDYGKGLINKQTILQVFGLIESFVWRRSILGLPSNSLDKIFSDLYKEIDQADYVKSLQKTLIKKKGRRRFPTDIEIIDALREKDVYSMKPGICMYFLKRLENFNNNEPVKLDKLTIEHIFPQNPDSKWKYELEENDFKQLKEKYINSIANLTLSGNNEALGNKAFQEKRDMPEKGYKDSRLFLNKYLATLETWNLKELENRFNIIKERFLQIWDYPNVALEMDDKYGEINIFEAEDPTDRKLEYFIFFDQKHHMTRVSECFQFVLTFLFKEQPDIFLNKDLRDKLKLTDQKDQLLKPLPLNEIYFIESNHSNKAKFERIKSVLTKFGITDELWIKYAPEKSMDIEIVE